MFAGVLNTTLNWPSLEIKKQKPNFLKKHKSMQLYVLMKDFWQMQISTEQKAEIKFQVDVISQQQKQWNNKLNYLFLVIWF